MKFTDQNIYDEHYVINILNEQAELYLKYGRIFTNRSQQTPTSKFTRERKLNNQSETNRIFEKKGHVNKRNEQAGISPNKIAIKIKRQAKLPLRNCQKLPLSTSEEMDREFFLWGGGATTEIREIIRRREKIPETRRLVERLSEIARPGMMRRRYNQNAQRTIWAL